VDLEAFATDLITSQNPLDIIFNTYKEIWKPLKDSNINEFYVDKERVTNKVEHFILKTFFDAYDILLAGIRKSEVITRFKPEDEKIILMDGMSIREAGILAEALEKRGYIIEEDTYAFSQMPSTTQSFMKQVFGVASLASLNNWDGYKVVTVSSGQVPAFLPQRERCILWVSFPDELLHHSRGIMNTPQEALSKTADVLVKAVDELDSDRFVLTSDHGYIYTKLATLFLKAHEADERVLKRVFGAARGLSPIESNPEIDQLRSLSADRNYAVFDAKGCYIKGRFYWSLPGRQPDVVHGGLSFMECLVPMMRFTRDKS
jgi:hypothetical protein